MAKWYPFPRLHNKEEMKCAQWEGSSKVENFEEVAYSIDPNIQCQVEWHMEEKLSPKKCEVPLVLVP